MEAYEVGIFRKRLPGADIERMVFGGYRINTRTGFVEFKDGNFGKFVGGPDVYRGVLLSAKDMGWPYIVVHGDEQHIVACMAHGAEVGMEVVPEVKNGDLGCLLTIIGLPIFCGCTWLASWWLDAWIDAAAGVAATIVIMCFLVEPAIEKITTRAARMRGQVYRNVLPNVHADVEHPLREQEIKEEFFEP
jgi:hypothetical protein